MSEQQEGVQVRSDEELIIEFQAGNVEAFNQLVERYKNQLMNFVFRFLGDYDEANDVVQDVFIRLYRKSHAYRPVAKFSTWIYTVASNLAKTQLRRRKSRIIFSLSRHDENRHGKIIEIPDVRYSVEKLADESFLHELIQQALNSISPKYREVVVLCDIQELTYEEVSRITGLNIGTIKSRLNRGRNRLKKLIQPLLTKFHYDENQY